MKLDKIVVDYFVLLMTPIAAEALMALLENVNGIFLTTLNLKIEPQDLSPEVEVLEVSFFIVTTHTNQLEFTDVKFIIIVCTSEFIKMEVIGYLQYYI